MKFAPLIRQRMFAHVRWRTCSFTKAANEQNSEHIRFVRSCYSEAKFADIRLNIRQRMYNRILPVFLLLSSDWLDLKMCRSVIGHQVHNDTV